MLSTHGRHLGVMLLALSVLADAGCGDDDDDVGTTAVTAATVGASTTAPGAGVATVSGPQTTVAPPTTTIDVTTSSGATTSVEATTTSVEATTSVEVTTDDGPTTDPRGPDIQLFTLPECDVVPGGALSGADVLNMYVAVRNGGPGGFDRLVPVQVSSNSGLGASLNAAIASGSAFNAVQVDVGDGNYNTRHQFTITADPSDEIVERDESNNVLQITVSLAERPTAAQPVTCTSP